MRVALCTTTVNVPHVLKLYRACAPGKFSDVKIFIAGDDASPHTAIAAIADECDSGKEWDVATQTFKHESPYMQQHFGNCEYYDVERQVQLGYKCSGLIGWKSIQRRNIAFLEALKWGADIIVSIDDDNIPIDPPNYFRDHRLTAFDGLMANNINTQDSWFDVGTLLTPPAKHRGFPTGYGPKITKFTHAVGAKIGVSAGICLGDPDIDAVTRIANAPEVHQVSQVLEAGVVVNPHTWTVFNSQNTAVLRELIPAWGMWPFVGRMDDIYASLLAQRVMRERGLHVHFGKPFCWQSRNEHNLIKDLRGELDGYECVARIADLLDHLQLAGKSVIDDCRRIWDTLNHCDFIPGRTVSAMCAYLDDCESVGCK